MTTGASAGPRAMVGSIVTPAGWAAAEPAARARTTASSAKERLLIGRPLYSGGMGFLLRVAVNALAIALAAHLVRGIQVDGVVSALVAGLALAVINAVVRPVLLVLTLPITLVTLGLFILALNGLCLWLAAAVVPGFHVAGFWAAVLGALCVSLVSWVATALVSDSGRIAIITRR